MITKIQKWGHSLALRIPKSLAVELNLKENSPLEIKLEDNRLVIYPAIQPEYKLTALLEQITPENIHAETDSSLPAGNEAW
jgi:antitoxin MazE